MLPLFWIAVSFAAGILVGTYVPFSAWIWGSLCLSFCLLELFLYKLHIQPPLIEKSTRYLRVSPLVLLVCFCLGGFRYVLTIPRWTQGDLAWYNGRGRVTLTAVVDEPPDRREDAVYYHVQARELYNAETMTYRRISGDALVRMNAGTDWQLGDLLRFSANPLTPSENEDFSYRRYLERQGVYTVIYHPQSVQRLESGEASGFALILEKIRQRASGVIYAELPQPESGLLEGILLGNDNNLPDPVQQAYQDTGTAHIIAISGFNMTVLAVLFITLFSRILPTRWAYLLTFIVLIVYTFFVGASPSVVRALIMAVTAYSGKLIGRKGGSLNALGAAAGVMLAINPLLLADASFQLSFAATLGLILFAGPLQKSLQRRHSGDDRNENTSRQAGLLSENFFTSLAAQITTLPVIALQFNRLSLTSQLANPLVLPVQQIILVGGMAATLTGMVWKAGGKVLAMFVWPLLAYSNRMVELLARIPHSAVELTNTTSLWLSLLFIFLIIGGILYFYRMKWWKKINSIYLLLALAIGAVLVWTAVLRMPDGNLHISVLNSGEGITLSLISPAGQHLLIDPTGSANTLSSEVSQSLNPWEARLDAVLFTNSQSAKELEGLNALLPVDTAIFSPSVYGVNDESATINVPAGVEVKELIPGESVLVDGGIRVLVIGSDNNHSALLVEYGNFRVLITGGLDPAAFDPGSKPELRSLSALILTDDDLDNLPADMWKNYGAKIVLWKSTSLAPDSEWTTLSNNEYVELSADANEFSIINSK